MTTGNEITVMTHEAWCAEAWRRFGPDYAKWAFVCPVCGNIATVGDFRPYASLGALPSSATCECIGRYRIEHASAPGMEGPVKKPCDYAGYGLLKLSPVRVQFPDGKESDCFAFAEAHDEQREASETPVRDAQPAEPA